MKFTNKLSPARDIIIIPAQSDTGKFKFISEGDEFHKNELFPQTFLYKYKKDDPIFKTKPIIIGSYNMSINNTNPFICSKDAEPTTIYWTSKSIIETIVNVALEGIDYESYYAYFDNDYICVSENKSRVYIELKNMSLN